ncbi:hypothetical protein LTR37_014797 [Vermiconidia calcicola]|uniref:Uncharacterized protein n=1 Tax=Vermiconidia calcicola TaxID=1690605 RepID=A0ACC3MU13_9PEZI|nr:hypothetical protein LTR37_014797 [Vermiconidia calcicola]
MADNNRSNFANLPKERVQEIASMGGKTSHGTNSKEDTNDSNGKEDISDSKEAGRNSGGTFTKGSEAAKAAGQKGSAHSHDNDSNKENDTHDKKADDAKEVNTHCKRYKHCSNPRLTPIQSNGRREDGTFKPGSEPKMYILSITYPVNT